MLSKIMKVFPIIIGLFSLNNDIQADSDTPPQWPLRIQYGNYQVALTPEQSKRYPYLFKIIYPRGRTHSEKAFDVMSILLHYTEQLANSVRRGQDQNLQRFFDDVVRATINQVAEDSINNNEFNPDDFANLWNEYKDMFNNANYNSRNISDASDLIFRKYLA